MTTPVTIVGGGLAGCEAAWQLARAGIPSVIYEMRPLRHTEAHKTDQLAELVCSNSFRSDNPDNAIGLLHRELRACGSLVLAAGDRNRVPAGDALAVDREAFAADVTASIAGQPLVTVRREEVTTLPEGDVIIATGPLTSAALAEVIRGLTGRDRLAFYDAIAPIVDAETIDRTRVFAQSRWDRGEGDDYLNCPMDRAQYEAFVRAIVAAEKVAPHEGVDDGVHYFPGCLPIEVMAEQGLDTLRHGPMKPIGLRDPRTGHRPWAVVQLRQENRAATAYNLVGFQTRMKYGEQARVFKTIPGLEGATFFRMGSVHRNTFIDSPRLLDGWLRVKTLPRVRLAGQITGVEGYVESAASGLLVAWALCAERQGRTLEGPPPETALGAMMGHLRDSYTGAFQPQNVNYGLFPPIGLRARKGDRKAAYAARAEAALPAWLAAATPAP